MDLQCPGSFLRFLCQNIIETLYCQYTIWHGSVWWKDIYSTLLLFKDKVQNQMAGKRAQSLFQFVLSVQHLNTVITMQW